MKIFVTRKIPEVGIEKLKAAGHEVIVSEKDGALNREELIANLKATNPAAVVSLLNDQIDGSVFDAAPEARVFANYAVGFDNIDLEEAQKRNVMVTNTPDVLTEAVAEHTVALILAVGRKIVESDKFLRNGNYEGWDPMLLLGMEFKGKTLGIVGCGRIGQRVAEIMHKGFGMSVIYYDERQNDQLESTLEANFVPKLEDLLTEADVVTIHLPATPATKHLFSAERLSLMKKTALLINTARGTIIDEGALAGILESNGIAGAGLDVFENEPDVNPALLPLSNVIVTPHTASATREARDRMSVMAADNVIAVLDGQTPPNSVL